MHFKCLKPQLRSLDKWSSESVKVPKITVLYRCNPLKKIIGFYFREINLRSLMYEDVKSSIKFTFKMYTKKATENDALLYSKSIDHCNND